MLTTPEQLNFCFTNDLGDSLLTESLCMFHSRLAPTRSRAVTATPMMIFRSQSIPSVAISNWMKAREAMLRLGPVGLATSPRSSQIIREGLEQRALSADALELLVRSGYSLSHAMIMLIARKASEKEYHKMKDFYKFHSCLMEP